MSGQGFFTVLEADLRQLSSDARRSEGFAGQLTGWLSGPEHPEIKEAAERALLKLRSYEGKPDSVGLVKGNKDILKPFLIACEVKSPKLVSVALVSIQKMLANDAVTEEGISSIITALEQVEGVHDEGVNLKLLQTALTLFQSPGQYCDQEQVRRVLSICFRLLSNQRNSDSVLNTAAATVRQAVALVFDHVIIEGQATKRPNSGGGGVPYESMSSDQGTAALKLLDDLCLLAVGQEAQWLKTPCLPRGFVLDVLDFVLANSVNVFKTIPEFEHALLVRICQLLINQLQDLLDKSKPDASDSEGLRVVLRVVRTVVKNFYRQLKAKCGVFIETLLEGMGSQRTLIQRILIMQVFRSWCSDTEKLQFLFETYDMRPDCKLKAVEQMVRCFADTIDSTLRLAAEFMEEDPMQMVAALYYNRLNGKTWTLDMDFGSAPSDVALGYLTMLAIDSLINVIMASEKLVDRVVEADEKALEEQQQNDQEDVPPSTPGSAPREVVKATWRVVHQALGQLLGRCNGEALVLQLLRGYQAMTQACGMLALNEARDAFLSSLCEMALVAPGGAEERQASVDVNALDGAATAANGLSVTSGYPSPGTPVATTPMTPMRAAVSPIEVGDGYVLTPKNVQALRTVFNIAHRLNGSLGTAWVLVLDTLNTLDRILNSPHTTTQELSSEADAGWRPSDLAILSTAANQLFESSSDMQLDAVVSMMQGLREVSMKQVPALHNVTGTPRLFAVNRMVELLFFNQHRLEPLWDVFMEHIIQLVSRCTKQTIRTAVLEALGKAISGLLSKSNPQDLLGSPTTRRVFNYTGTDAGGKGADVNTEIMLLEVLGRMYNAWQETDVKLGSLRVTMTVLQHHGEQLSKGWEPLLELLESVSHSLDVDLIRLAFQNIQLVSSDYLSVMPYKLMRRALEVAALYGQQQVDLNVSLTAISLLWNAADVVGKSYEASGTAVPMGGPQLSTASSHHEPGSGSDDHHAVHSITLMEYLDIMGLLFAALQALCTDSRPEVRNSGVRTLFSVVNTAGSRLTMVTWEEVLWGMLFPLVRTVHHMAATSSREEAEGQVLGRGVKMLVHHSRNSEQKQWDETLVLALNGMAKIFKSHLSLIVNVQGLEGGWEELMLVVESSVAGGRKETALAAVSLISTVLIAHANSSYLSRAMWRRALRALDVGIEAATSPTCMVPLTARLELVNTINALYTHHRPVFDAEDLRQLYGWVEKFARNPCSVEDMSTVMPGSMPAVQKAILGLLPALAPVAIPEVWPDVFSTLLRLLRPHVLEHSAATKDEKTTSVAMQRVAYSSAAMEKVVEVLLDMYTEHVPWQVKAAEFSRLVTSLGRCMATRFTVYHKNLWRQSAVAFSSVVTAGLPAVNVAFAEEHRQFDEAWGAMAEAFEWFFLGTLLTEQQLKPPPPTSGHLRRLSTPMGREAAESMPPTPTSARATPLSSFSEGDENGNEADKFRSAAELEGSVLDTMTDVALTACSVASTHMRQRLIRILDKGIVRPRHLNLPQMVTGSRFSHACLRKMYVLCSRGAQAQVPCLLEVAQLTLPVLLSRCDHMLRSYVNYQHRMEETPDLHMPDAPTVDEVMCVLEVLATMTLSSPVVDAAITKNKDIRGLVELIRQRGDQRGRGRERTHLLLVYNALAECITLKEARVREMVRDVMALAGAELGLAGCPT